jgi:hypothetical protein
MCKSDCWALQLALNAQPVRGAICRDIHTQLGWKHSKAPLSMIWLACMYACRVLDLGSGSGRDCYVCAALVGPEGSVTGEKKGLHCD